MDAGNDFLIATLGKQAAEALQKACARDACLADVLVPRSILGWLLQVEEGFEGNIPGVQNSYLEFAKNERGTYDGHVSLPDTDGLLPFYGANLSGLAATIAAAVGVDCRPADPRLRDQVVVALGKHIDSLAATQVELAELKKSLGPKVISEHGAYRVEKAEDGKYMVVAKSGGVLRSAIRSAREAADYADGQKSLWGGSFRHTMSKKDLDPAEGYTLRHKETQDYFKDENPETVLHVTAHAPGGKQVGMAQFHPIPGGQGIRPSMVVVDEEHQRKGLATAMYRHAEQHTGLKIHPSVIQTDEGAALWRQPNRPFGKGGNAEGPGPAAPPQAPEAPEGPQGVQSRSAKPKGVQGPAKPARIRSQALTQSEAARKCARCGGSQFAGVKFKGCVCFADLAKSIRTTAYADGYVLDFSDDVDPDGVRALVRALKAI